MATVSHDHTVSSTRRFGFPNLRISTADELTAYAKANAAATGHDEDLVEATVKETGPPIIITVTFTIVDASGDFSEESIKAALKNDRFKDKLNEEIAKDNTLSGFQATAIEDPTSESKIYINNSFGLYYRDL